ncbi:hypothetical protein SAMN05421504_102591 [Amycolatopsis xylanica]|uniref:SnoaL-like domain-containing protein n=1 Tax=Amycolatopsis xylanica TaxID=589385 RepID=A0A1H2ZMK7_9PSEU|nr:ester cyclase [Amycolatopsis xylanica]SDX18660.1 hypothetical protein SAMN05421504_102591 [Amycolatopsis xylanica]
MSGNDARITAENLTKQRLDIVRAHLESAGYRPGCTGFPDERAENVHYHVAEDSVVAEFDLLGTATGRNFTVRSAACFVFEAGGDRIVGERRYFDRVSYFEQLGLLTG